MPLPLLLPPCVLALPAAPPAQVRDLLGVPYVDDAVREPSGRWTTFAHPEQTLASPGLNCSGLTYALATRLLDLRLEPARAARDRLGDSGEGAPGGRDWDFGLDLVLNLSEGLLRRVLTPRGPVPAPGDGRGFPMEDAGAWASVLPLLRPGRVYLVSLSRERPLRHYHTAVILAEGSRAWFYHTLPGGRSHRVDLASEAGLARLQKAFGRGKRVLVLEVEPRRR